MSIIEVIESYGHKIDDSLNAILVKDLRQIVRGKFLWSIFFLYLAIIVFILFASISEASMNRSDGEFISGSLLLLLFVVAGLLVPMHIGKTPSAKGTRVPV